MEERAILINGWIQEHNLREFVESLVRLVGGPGCDPHVQRLAGTVSLNFAGRLDEFFWQRLRTLVALTESNTTTTWVGFAWRGACEARCELQRDDGYDGVRVRVEVPPELTAGVEVALEEGQRVPTNPRRVPVGSPFRLAPPQLP